MPFYFAIPRKGGSTQKGGGDTTYQRTAPSALIISAVSAIGFVASGLLSMMSCVAAAILGTNDGTSNSAYISYYNLDPYPTLPYIDGIQMKIPDIVIAYKTRPPPADQEILDSWHLEPEKINTVKKEVYILRNPTYEQAKQVSTFSGLMEHYRPTHSSISVSSLLTFLDLMGRVSLAARCLLGITTRRVYLKMEGGYTEPKAKSVGPDAIMEEGEVDDVEEKWIQFQGRHTDLSVFADKSVGSRVIWGSIEQFLAGKEDGIFCPYNQDFSAPDPTIINRFVATFKDLFVEEYGEDADSADLEDIQQAWATEICTTMSGHYMAHLMMSLILAAEGGAWVYTIQDVGRTYEGTIIVKSEGEFSIRGAGLNKVSSISYANLHKELAEFGFHTVILAKILALVGNAVVQPNDVLSMRHLREIVFAGTGMPDGATRNKISRLLPRLAFPEKPLGINASTIDKVMQLLADPNIPLPRDLFLPSSVFFVDDSDRTRLVLSAWGDNPPTFNYGGTPLMATGQKGKGTSAKMAEYNAMPPRVLQMKRVPMDTAVQGWNTLLSHGYIWGIYDRKLTQGRAFNGPEKTQVWNILNKWAAVTVVPKNLASTSTEVTGPGLKRIADEQTVGDRGQIKKKRVFK